MTLTVTDENGFVIGLWSCLEVPVDAEALLTADAA
jgi:hypothetical protein